MVAASQPVRVGHGQCRARGQARAGQMTPVSGGPWRYAPGDPCARLFDGTIVSAGPSRVARLRLRCGDRRQLSSSGATFSPSSETVRHSTYQLLFGSRCAHRVRGLGSFELCERVRALRLALRASRARPRMHRAAPRSCAARRARTRKHCAAPRSCTARRARTRKHRAAPGSCAARRARTRKHRAAPGSCAARRARTRRHRAARRRESPARCRRVRAATSRAARVKRSV